jgi:triosephosphate isomerase (TIM)
MKRTLIVANWKMNLNVHEASLLVKRLNDHIQVHKDIEVVLAPSLLTLQPISKEIDTRKFKLAAQNAYFKDEGAFTGEVSFTMLQGLVDYCIVGHSERRTNFDETLEVVRDKMQAAVRNRITPILCVGETKHEHMLGETKRVIHDKLTTALINLTPEEVSKIVIAYEPIWAIGSGDPEKPDSIRKVVGWIRQILEEVYGVEASTEPRILYGASVAPEFVGGILSIEGVDGLLVGGASLNYKKFSDIVDNAYRLQHQPEKSDG